MTRIIDLDEILGEDKQVRLRGETYVLPPDLPIETYLKVQRLAASEASEVEMFELLHGEILELFRYGDPSIESLPLSLTQCVTLIARVYGEAAAQEETKRPPRRSSSGGAKRTGSRARR